MTTPKKPSFALVAFLGSALAMTYIWCLGVVWTDDALIYFRIARNVSDGFGPVLNIGDSHTAGTSLAWIYLLAGATTLFPDVGLPTLAMVFSALLTFGSSLFLCYALKQTVGILALLAPLALVSIPLFRMLPGLETALAVFALSLALWSWFSIRSLPLTATVVALAFFCRGDAVILGIPIGVHFLVSAIQKGSSREEIRTQTLRAIAAASIVLLVGSLIQWTLTGQILPSTLQAKMIQGLGGKLLYSERFFVYAVEAVGGSRWFFLLVLVGVVRAGVPGLILLGTAFLHAAAYRLMSVADYPWYSWILQLSLALLVVIGFASVVQWVCVGLANRHRSRFDQSRNLERGAAGVALLASAGFAIWLWVSFNPLPRFEHDPSIGGAGFIKTYHRVAQHLCNAIHEQGEPGDSEIFLGEEIGVIGFYCPELLVRDVNGLASPGLTIENLNDWDFWIARYSPKYLVMRGDQGLNRIFGGDGVRTGRLYRRIMKEQEPDFGPVTVYERDEKPGTAESLSHLAPLLRHAPSGPDVKLLWTPGDIQVLFAHAPSELRVTIPEWANRVEVGFGILPAPAEARGEADGVTFEIIGITSSGSERPSFTEHLSASTAPDPNGIHTATLDSSSPRLRTLRLITRTGPVPKWDWSYWSHIEFKK